MWTTLSVKAKHMSFGLVSLTTEVDIFSATNQQILRIEESLILLSKYLQLVCNNCKHIVHLPFSFINLQ